MKSIFRWWGEWPGQTAGITKKGTHYLQGYDPRGNLVQITFNPKEVPDIVEAMFNVQRRGRNL